MKRLVLLFIFSLICTPLYAGIDFDGADDFVNCGTSSGLEMNTMMTASMWFNPDAVNLDQAVLSKWQDTANDRAYLMLVGQQVQNAKVELWIAQSNLTVKTSTASSNLSASTWHHLAGVADGTNVILYLDGVAQGAGVGYDGTLSPEVTRNLLLGKLRTEDNGYMTNGKISEVAIWDIALSAEEIALLASSKVKRMPLQIKPIGYGLNCDGSNEYVACGTGVDQTTNDFSISWWMKASATNDVVFSNRETSSPYSGMYCLIDSNHLYMQLNDQSNSHVYDSGSADVRDNAWHHCVVIVDRGNNLMHFYVDGSSDAANIDISAVSGSITSTAAFWIASDFGGSPLAGAVDEMAVWSEVLSANDVSDLYNGGAGLYINKGETWPTDGGAMGTNLVALWHLDEGTGTSAADSSANSNTGTLTNMEAADWQQAKVRSPNMLQAYWPMDDGPFGTSADGDTVVNMANPGTNDGTGDDGAGNDNLLWSGESNLTYP